MQTRTTTRLGNVDHKHIIGKKIRDVVVSSKGKELRLHAPTLDEYIVMTPRLVTPIYPADANLIVSLLDLHPGSLEPSSGTISPIEVLEAGTGHGSLTLHLARAVHAANVGIRLAAACVDQSLQAMPRAIIHTVDVSSKYSQHAAKIVGDFRRGMYLRNVNFHVGNVSEWIEQQMHARGPRPFLSHVLLDLPSSHNHVGTATSALHVDGKLLVFNPSITQINSVVQYIKAKRLPLQLERVVEVGPSMTGGRIWDVRFAKPRALIKGVDENVTFVKCANADQAVKDDAKASCLDDGEEEQPHDQKSFEIVCRPKSGTRISGGGFVALWSRNRTRQDD
ncbi:MAG: hypothetical protein LQ349_001363 [Xanthoria aureola]|nr:MAG: hypothetical protein LQ349_001363 [Xanthoria aureola]